MNFNPASVAVFAFFYGVLAAGYAHQAVKHGATKLRARLQATAAWIVLMAATLALAQVLL